MVREVINLYEESNVLMHIGKGHDDNPPGRGSGRYPFGSGDRPFQRISSGELSDQKLEDLIRRAPASEILKYEDVLSVDELNKALTRINYQARLKEYSSNEKSDFWKKSDNFFTKLGKVNNYYRTGAAFYQNVIQVYRYLVAMSKLRKEQEQKKKEQKKK